MQTQRLFQGIMVIACGILFASCQLIKNDQKGVNPSLIIMNVLDKSLYDDCHIKGSVHVPLAELGSFVQNLDRESTQIVTYCSNYMCTASGYAAKVLKDMGFKHVWAYEGGMEEWYQQGLPIEGPCKAPYLTRTTAPGAHLNDAAPLVITLPALREKIETMQEKS